MKRFTLSNLAAFSRNNSGFSTCSITSDTQIASKKFELSSDKAKSSMVPF